LPAAVGEISSRACQTPESRLNLEGRLRTHEKANLHHPGPAPTDRPGFHGGRRFGCSAPERQCPCTGWPTTDGNHRGSGKQCPDGRCRRTRVPDRRTPAGTGDRPGRSFGAGRADGRARIRKRRSSISARGRPTLIQSLREEVATQTDRIETITGRVADLEAQLETTDGELSAALESIALKDEQLAGLRSANMDLQSEIDSARNQMSDLRDDVAAKADQIATMATDTSTLRTQLEAARNELSTAMQDLDSRGEQVSRLESQTIDLRAQLDTEGKSIGAGQPGRTGGGRDAPHGR
jgi:peptidoglycan hydrolase CwlO-like protein